MNFVVLGTSEFTVCCARGVLDSKGEISALISMPACSRPLNSNDLSGFAEEHGLRYHEIEDINSPTAIDLLKSYSATYILSSWPKMLKKNVLNIPQRYIIGTHPTELPLNRGRHPLHWIIIQGITKTKLSFFHMDKGVDTGKILLQVPVTISPYDSINDLMGKINNAAYYGTKQLYRLLMKNPDYDGNDQDHELANYWRKRTPHDVTLDFRMSSESILRTVRSFTLPYPCANFVFEKYVIKVSKAELSPAIMPLSELQRIEPGKIISIDRCTIRIKTADGIVELECLGQLPAPLLKAKYVHPPSRYIIRWPRELAAQMSV